MSILPGLPLLMSVVLPKLAVEAKIPAIYVFPELSISIPYGILLFIHPHLDARRYVPVEESLLTKLLLDV